MRNRGGCIAKSIFCILLTFFMLPCTVKAQNEQEMQTVRVGFFEFDGYHMKDEQGACTGYGYEILQHLVGYTNWKFEYVGYEKSWSEMQQMLENGEIDILTSAQKTPEREKRFDFSEKTIGASTAIMTVKAGNTTYLGEDYPNWNGIRVGFIYGNSRNQGFHKFAREKGFSYSPVFFDNTEALIEALKEGTQIDAVVTSNLRLIEDEWVLAQFDSSPFYIMVQKGNSELLEQINQAIEQMDSNEPDVRTMLMNKYYNSKNGDEIPFSVEERAYIEAMNDTTFTAIINPDRAPLSYAEDGQVVGIIPDIADEIIRRSGLNIEFVKVDSRLDYKQQIESGEIDIRFDAGYDYAKAESTDCRLTVPYVDVSVAKLSRRENTSLRSVALLRNSDLASILEDYLIQKSLEVVYYDTIQELVHAVLTNKQDAAYLYQRSAELAVQNDVTNRLVSESIYGYDNSFSIAVSDKESPLLYSILNKAIASISKDEIAEINHKYTSYSTKPFSIIGFIYAKPMAALGMVLVCCLLIALSVAYAFTERKRKREYEQLQKEKRRGELLADALETAESAGKAKSRFLSHMSHEMRTPLNAIIGFIELAKDAGKEQTELCLQNSDVAAKQLLSIINDVLDMAAIESGKMKLSLDPFDFKYTVQSLTNLYLSQCQKKGIAYDTRLLTPLEDWLVGDQLRLNQILINLLNNAVKFTQQGHITLSISQYDTTNDETVFLRFEVADTGCGMSEDMQARLFKPFEQEDAGTTQKYGGSGLGLSIVKNLVNMMNGAIRVESQKDIGTKFVVDLPFRRSKQMQEEIKLNDIEKINLFMRFTGGQLGEKEVPRGNFDFRGKRVLIAEDNEMNQMVVMGILKKFGVEGVCAEDGQIALNMFMESEAGYYDAVLMDIQMPNINGLDAARDIRNSDHPDAKTIQIIALTADAFNEDIARTLSAGMNAHVSKPIEPELLAKALEIAFHKSEK